MTEPSFVPFTSFVPRTEAQMVERARAFYEEVNRRRTVREFSDRPVAEAVIRDCLRAAGTAPSGANLQPWHFVVVTDPEIKRQIRVAAEDEEREFYQRRAPKEWLEALAPLGTNEHKPFLEQAPVLIAVFSQKFGWNSEGHRTKHYYAIESVGLATGILITACHHAGLVSLTHTPSPMRFLNNILQRPDYEQPFLLLVVGYPEDEACVPDIERKPLEEICSFL